MKKKLVQINDYYECEIEVQIQKTRGQLIENLAVIEVRLYEKCGEEELAGGGTTTRSLINTFKEEVKRPNLMEFLLGLSWNDRIDTTREHLKKKAIHRAAELWYSEKLPNEIRNIIKEME